MSEKEDKKVEEKPKEPEKQEKGEQKGDGKDQREHRFKRGACFNCGKEGHISRNCPEKRSSYLSFHVFNLSIEPRQGGDDDKRRRPRRYGRKKRPRREFKQEPLDVTLETEIPKAPFKADLLPRPTDKELYELIDAIEAQIKEIHKKRKEYVKELEK